MSLNVGGTADADVEVRLEDQNAINEFGRLNNRVVEIRAEIKQAKEDSEKMDDAVVDLSMAEGKVMLFMGETFIETTEEYATEYCESKMEKLRELVETLSAEEKSISDRQAVLKKTLYARFGNSINLENS